MNETIGTFEILGLLGTGGSGTVYRARDTRVGRTVAVRVIGDPSGDHARRARFIDAVRPFTGVSHPNVATLFDVGEHKGCAVLAYEFVPGDRLSAVAAGRPLNLRRAIDICTQVADALAEAHAFELVHGLLTPSSIAVTTRGRVKVLDFGIAAWHAGGGDRQTAARLADRGTALGHGAVAYMAPEQVLGQPAGACSDVFALGVILYELLTGRRPFEAAEAADTAVRIVQHTPPPPGRVNPEVPPEVDAIVARALAKPIGDRYASAAEMAADLRSAASTILQRESAAEMALVAPARRASAAPWRLLLLTALFAAAVGLAAFTFRDALGRAWQSWGGVKLAPVVAVMPLSVEGPDVTRTWVGPGLSEELGTQLAQVPGLLVKGRTSVRSLGGRPPAAVAAEMRASAVVTGTVSPSPSGWTGIDLRLDLVDGATGTVTWSGRYQGAAADALALVGRAALDIVAQLDVASVPTPLQRRAALRLANPEALDNYLQGREAMAEGDTSRAVARFDAAASLDPGFTEAQAALVEALYRAAVFDTRLSFAGVAPRISQVAEAASAVDADRADVALAMGLAAPTVPAALAHIRRAIELDRSSAWAYLAASDLLRDVDPARAISCARRAGELDPAQPLALYYEAAASLAAGQRADALAVIARGQALLPEAAWWDALRQRANLAGPRPAPTAVAARSVSDFVPAAMARALDAVAANRFDDAVNILGIVARVTPEFCEARALLAGVHHAAGERAEGQRLAAEIADAARAAAAPSDWARCAAMAAAGVGDAALAARWVRAAAGDDRALRTWGATSAVMAPHPAIAARLFPWSRVAGNPQFAAAVAALDAAMLRTRAAVAKTLDGLL
jgi:serine/threonine-protein kinase